MKHELFKTSFLNHSCTIPTLHVSLFARQKSYSCSTLYVTGQVLHNITSIPVFNCYRYLLVQFTSIDSQVHDVYCKGTFAKNTLLNANFFFKNYTISTERWRVFAIFWRTNKREVNDFEIFIESVKWENARSVRFCVAHDHKCCLYTNIRKF